MLTTLVLFGAVVLFLGGCGILSYILRSDKTATTKVTVLSVVAGILFGITTNVGTYYLLKGVNHPPASVTINPIRDQVTAAKNFSVSGSATITDDRHELWVIVYRPAGGFDIANRASIVIATDGTWVFDLVNVGRPPEETGQPSPDAGLTYTISAVIVDEQGAVDLRDAVNSVPTPEDPVFVKKQQPSGVIATDSTHVRLP